MNEDLHKLIEAAKAIAKENSSAYNEIKKSYVEKEIFRKDSFMKLAADDDISPAVDIPEVAETPDTEPTAPEDPTKQKVPKLDPAEFFDSTIKDLLEIFWETIDGMADDAGRKIKDLREVEENVAPMSSGIFSLTEFLKKIQFRQVYEFSNSYTGS